MSSLDPEGNELRVPQATTRRPSVRSDFDMLLIDAPNLAVRAWWPHRDRVTSRGAPSGLEHGFLGSLLGLVREQAPAYPVLCWDGAPARGRALCPAYKVKPAATGTKPGWWAEHSERLRDALAALVPTCYASDAEADEQIAALVARLDVDGSPLRIGIVSNDKDFHQLVSGRTRVIAGPKTVIGLAEVEAKWDLRPRSLPIYRSLEGDRSDNLVGVKGLRVVTRHRIAQTANGSWDVVRRLASEEDWEEEWLSVNERAKLCASWSQVASNYEIMRLRDRREWAPVFLSRSGSCRPVEDLCRQYELHEVFRAKEWALLGRPEPTWWALLRREIATPEGVGSCVPAVGGEQ